MKSAGDIDQGAEMRSSLLGRYWNLPQADLGDLQRVISEFQLPEIAARILLQRGIGAGDVASFLDPKIRNLMPDPFVLVGMEKCAKDLAQAIIDQSKIGIFTDYDVDGATSAAVISKFLRMCGCEDIPLYVPERFTEGFGPNTQAMQSLKDQGAEIILILDCGSSSDQVLRDASEMGLKVVVVDHHDMDHVCDDAWHMINPARPDDESDLSHLAAVGVSFMLCVAINRELRDQGRFHDAQAPDLMSLLDFVALGTVCDMMPMSDLLNRAFVKSGLPLMERRSHLGLNVLLDVAEVSAPITVQNCGFDLGPRLNAGARMAQSTLAARLLTTEFGQEEEAWAWVQKLSELHQARKSAQKSVEQSALKQVQKRSFKDQEILIVSGENWSPGVTGLAAGKLAERFYKPACVIAWQETDQGIIGTASGRSIPGIHLGEVFGAAMAQGLLLKGGGHAMAGGFTIAQDKLDAFIAFAQDHARTQRGGRVLLPEKDLDGVLSVSGANLDLIDALGRLEPFGQGFTNPIFKLSDVKIERTKVIGQKQSTISCQISDYGGGARLKGIGFGIVDTAMGEALLKAGPFHGGPDRFDLIGHVEANEWQGQISPQFRILDAYYA